MVLDSSLCSPDAVPHPASLWLFQASESKAVLEVGDLEGDTLDPQTGLFYRSSQPAADPVKPTSSSAGAQPPPLSQAEAEQSRHTSTSTSAQAPPPPPPPQLQSKPQMSQPSSSSTAFPSTPPLTKKLPKLREQTLPKPQTLTQIPKDRPLPAPAQLVVKVTTPSTPTKLLVTPQLPKLQQAPTSHHRPLHTPMSHPPPLQAHHPVSTEKTVSSQVSGRTTKPCGSTDCCSHTAIKHVSYSPWYRSDGCCYLRLQLLLCSPSLWLDKITNSLISAAAQRTFINCLINLTINNNWLIYSFNKTINATTTLHWGRSRLRHVDVN